MDVVFRRNAPTVATEGPMESRSSKAAELRRKAEQRVEAVHAPHAGVASQADAAPMLHELQVHQIELEMQNEELQRARAAAEEASAKYGDLFDFAPIGYFLWDAKGTILEVNLAGAALLGLDRNAVVQKRFRQFVAMENRSRFADFCNRVMTTDAKQLCEVELLRGDEPAHAPFEGIAAQGLAGQGRLLPCGGHRHQRIRKCLKRPCERPTTRWKAACKNARRSWL